MPSRKALCTFPSPLRSKRDQTALGAVYIISLPKVEGSTALNPQNDLNGLHQSNLTLLKTVEELSGPSRSAKFNPSLKPKAVGRPVGRTFGSLGNAFHFSSRRKPLGRAESLQGRHVSIHLAGCRKYVIFGNKEEQPPVSIRLSGRSPWEVADRVGVAMSQC